MIECECEWEKDAAYNAQAASRQIADAPMLPGLSSRSRVQRRAPNVARQLCAAVGGRLSDRANALAAGSGAAAAVWEQCNVLASQPGMINMGQGFPDFEGSAVAREVAAEALRQGGAPLNQYSPQPGLLTLRESVAAFHSRRYAAEYNPATEVIVTAGAQEALAASFSAFLDPGDEVVLFEPFYPFMLGAVRLAGAVPRVRTVACICLLASRSAIYCM